MLRRSFTTFMIDRHAVENRHRIGLENMMSSTDYPHHGCDWPETRRTVARLFAGVPDIERAALTAGNALALYGLA